MKSYGALYSGLCCISKQMMREQREHHSTCLAIPDSLNTLVSSGYILRFTILLLNSSRKIFGLFFAQRHIFSSGWKHGQEISEVDKTDLSRLITRTSPMLFSKSNCTSKGKFVSHPCCEVERIDLSRIFGTRWITQDVDKLSISMLISRRLNIRTG